MFKDAGGFYDERGVAAERTQAEALHLLWQRLCAVTIQPMTEARSVSASLVVSHSLAKPITDESGEGSVKPVRMSPQAIDNVGLLDVLHAYVNTLSGQCRRKYEIALAVGLAHRRGRVRFVASGWFPRGWSTLCVHSARVTLCCEIPSACRDDCR